MLTDIFPEVDLYLQLELVKHTESLLGPRPARNRILLCPGTAEYGLPLKKM